MSEENISQVDEKFCLDDAKPTESIEESSVGDGSIPLPAAVSNMINHVNPRRYSTGALVKRGQCKAEASTRYSSSTHDLCKHGKRREEDLVMIKPWKLVKKKNVEEGQDLVRKSLQVTKRDAGKRNETKSSSTPSDLAVPRNVKKTNLNVNKSSKEDLSKNLKKIDESVVLEKTVYVVESSIEEEKKKKKKSIKNEIQQSSEKKILRGSGKKSLSLIPSLSPSSEPRVTRSDPKPIRQTTSKSKIGLSEKKDISSSSNLVANSKTESKIRPKSIGLTGLRVNPPPPTTSKQVGFKKGKVLEPKQADSTPTLIKFKKRVVQEPKLRSSDVNKKKKNLKDRRESLGRMNGEVKREKVVLRHRKVEVKKKLQTLFNNVIEETVSKLEEVRKKSKVKALVGAFETVISLQDNDKTSQKKKKVQSKSTSSQVV